MDYYERGNQLAATGDFAGAVDAYRASVTSDERLHGRDSVEVAQSLHQLAWAIYRSHVLVPPDMRTILHAFPILIELQQQGAGVSPEMARGLHDALHAAGTLSDDLVLWLSTLMGRGIGAEDPRREALALVNEAIEIKLRKLGDRHCSTARSVVVQGQILVELDEWDQALEVAVAACRMFELCGEPQSSAGAQDAQALLRHIDAVRQVMDSLHLRT